MRRRSAFTLIELLTAITIFSVVIAVISTSYVFFIRQEREVALVRKVYAEARDLMDRFSTSVKEGVPDYAVYTGATPLTSVADVTVCANPIFTIQSGRIGAAILVMLDAARTTRTVYCASTDGVLYFGTGAVDSMLTLAPLSSGVISFDTLGFLITPIADPFDAANVADNSVQFQPAVTISTVISGTSTQQPFDIPLMTTVSSRVYAR